MTSSVAGRDLQRPLLGLSVVPFQLAYTVSIHKAQGLEYNSAKEVIPSSNSGADLPRHFLYSHHPCKGKIKNLLECGYNQSDYRIIKTQFLNAEAAGPPPVFDFLALARSIIRVHSQVYMEHHDSAGVLPFRDARDEGSRWESGAMPRSRMCLRLPFEA